MTKQVEPELSSWSTRRRTLNQELYTALTSRDFSAVETNQYGAASAGVTTPYPVSTDMETKLLNEMRNLKSTTFNAGDSISITLQVNTLESFRRAYLARKQTKRDLLRHLTQKMANEAKYDALMLQQFISADKVLNQS